MFAPSWDGVDQKGMFVVVAEYSIMRTRFSKLERVDWTIPLILQVNLDVPCRAQELTVRLPTVKYKPSCTIFFFN